MTDQSTRQRESQMTTHSYRQTSDSESGHESQKGIGTNGESDWLFDYHLQSDLDLRVFFFLKMRWV
jgi:hypothetical protein